MEAKHAGKAGQARHVPDRQEPRSGEPIGMDEAVENATTGLPVDWARQFDHHRRDDGTTFYVDTATGQTYDTLPAMHDKDGGDM